jgi:hypothetical protein
MNLDNRIKVLEMILGQIPVEGLTAELVKTIREEKQCSIFKARDIAKEICIEQFKKEHEND